MACVPFPTPIVLTPVECYSPEKWKQKRSIITQFYRDEANSLDHVRAILAQHHAFRPTVAMLKKRISQWDLDRKHKQADMLYALRLAIYRETQGKKTVFLIRSRIVTFHDVKQYFQRKGVHDLRPLITDASAAVPTTRIDCRTPEPDAITDDNTIYNPESPIATPDLSQHHDPNVGNFHANPTIMALPDPYQVDHRIPLTGTLSQLDQLLHLSRDYYDAVFENPDWRSKDNAFEIGSLEKFYHHMFDGQLLLERSCFNEAFEHFGSAFDIIHYLLNEKIFLFLPYLYHMLLPGRQISQQEVLSRLLGFVSKMIQECYSQLYPIQRSLTLLHHMSAKYRGESSKRVFQSILDRLQVEFKANVPDKSELFSDVVCQTRENLNLDQCLGNYKLISIAVWQLSKDAELLQLFSRHNNTILHYPMRTLSDTEWYGYHSNLKPENILCLKGVEDSLGVFQLADFGLGHTYIWKTWNPLVTDRNRLRGLRRNRHSRSE